MEDGQKTSIKNPVIQKPSPKVTKSRLFFIANVIFLISYGIYKGVFYENQYGCYQCWEREKLLYIFAGGSFILSILILIKTSISRSKVRAGIEEKKGPIRAFGSLITIYCIIFALLIIKSAFPIHDAVHGGSRTLVLFQFMTGTSPNQPSSLLNLRLSYNETETYLFNLNFNHRNSSSWYSRLSPLHLVQNKSMAQFLIERGADVNSREFLDLTPLHLARNTEIAEVLIRNGADVNAKSRYGETPIFFVANEEVLRTLIENGADINARNSDGETLLDLARDPELKELLVKYGAKLS